MLSFTAVRGCYIDSPLSHDVLLTIQSGPASTGQGQTSVGTVEAVAHGTMICDTRFKDAYV